MLTHAFFKSGERHKKFNQPYQTSNAVDNKLGRIRHVALDKQCHPTYITFCSDGADPVSIRTAHRRRGLLPAGMGPIWENNNQHSIISISYHLVLYYSILHYSILYYITFDFFKLRASNPRTIAYAHLNMPFESSYLPGAGLIFPDCPMLYIYIYMYIYIYIYIYI